MNIDTIGVELLPLAVEDKMPCGIFTIKSVLNQHKNFYINEAKFITVISIINNFNELCLFIRSASQFSIFIIFININHFIFIKWLIFINVNHFIDYTWNEKY